MRYGTNLPGQSDFPATLAAGESFMARADASMTLEVPENALRIRYYHQDHLGSSSSVTDSSGQIVSESAFYGFGAVRTSTRLCGAKESYLFTQKESDAESGLRYLEARVVMENIGWFVSVDPLAQAGNENARIQPQKQNVYAYCRQNPLNRIDPSGMEDLSLKQALSLKGKSQKSKATCRPIAQDLAGHLLQLKGLSGEALS